MKVKSFHVNESEVEKSLFSLFSFFLIQNLTPFSSLLNFFLVHVKIFNFYFDWQYSVSVQSTDFNKLYTAGKEIYQTFEKQIFNKDWKSHSNVSQKTHVLLLEHPVSSVFFFSAERFFQLHHSLVGPRRTVKFFDNNK